MKKNLKTIFLSIGLVFSLNVLVWGFIMPGGQVGKMHFYQLAKGKMPQRIISMAPGITETLFAIGAEKQVVGVTDYCDYPERTQKLPKVGGYYDPNFEMIVRLKPDLVILLPEHAELRARFQYLHISTLTVEMNRLIGMMNTFYQLGMLCQKEAQAFQLINSMQTMILKAKAQPVVEPRPSVMLVISRDYAETTLNEIYIAGKGDFYDELITLAGGRNVYTKATPRYPKLSREGLLSLHPDVVIEIVAEPDQAARATEALLADWDKIPGFDSTQKSVKKIITGTYLVRPGPRMIQLFETLRQIIQAGNDL